MSDTTNLLDADGDQIVAEWFTHYTDSPRNALCRLRDEIVRQAREGMVPASELAAKAADHLAEYGARNAVERENARLRAELATAKREGAVGLLSRLISDESHVWDIPEHTAQVVRRELAKLRESFSHPAPAVADTPEPCVEHNAPRRTCAKCCRWMDAQPVADTGEREAAVDAEGYIDLTFVPSQGYLRIRPKDCARIVAMGGGK